MRKRSLALQWLLGLGGGFVGLALLGLIALGLIVESGLVPDSAVQRGDKLSERARRELHELGVISEGEEILYFYSAGITSFKSDGNFFTPTRVVSYETVDGKFWMAEASFEDISDITFEDSDSLFEDSVLTIQPNNEDAFYLIVSSEDHLDEEFHRVLMETWERRRATAARKPE